MVLLSVLRHVKPGFWNLHCTIKNNGVPQNMGPCEITQVDWIWILNFYPWLKYSPNMSVYIYIYIFIHIRIHIHMYIYIYISREREDIRMFTTMTEYGASNCNHQTSGEIVAIIMLIYAGWIPWNNFLEKNRKPMETNVDVQWNICCKPIILFYLEPPQGTDDGCHWTTI